MRKGIAWIMTMVMIFGMMAISGLTVSAVTYRDGDVNGDGEITTADVRMLLRNMVYHTSLSAAQYDASDANNDGIVNTTDAKFVLGRVIAELDVETKVSLLAPTMDSWYNPVMRQLWAGSAVSETTLMSGGYQFTNNGSFWPRAVYVYDDTLVLPENAVIEYDLTVNGEATSINLYTNGSIPYEDDLNTKTDTMIKLNSYISSENVSADSGDLLAGSYKGTIPVSSIVAGDEHRKGGMIALSAIEVYVVGDDNSTVTINKLNVTAIKDPTMYRAQTALDEKVRPTLVNANETAGLSNLTGMQMYVNGKKSSTKTMMTTDDNKKIYRTATMQRVFNYADGYRIDLPMDWEPDFSLSELRSRYTNDTYSLTITLEDKNPYSGASGWETYMNEWLTRYIASSDYLANNNMYYMRDPITSTSLISGYTVMLYDITMTDGKGEVNQIQYPHYSYAIIRKNNEYNQFYFMVLKSAAPTDVMMDRLIRSIRFFTPQGTAVNGQQQYELKIPEYWSDETRAYYNKLMNQESVDFGFFSASMVDRNDSSFDYQHNRIQTEYERLSTAMNYEYKIMPTYSHLSWYGNVHHFPLEMANEFAGGNGFNGKPVLQFTYQYTNNNNTSLYATSCLFEIIRGDYDAHFREMAQDIKAYGKPVLFRLNNEMNTDWTSYSGIANMLDPDIFVESWRHLYDIFVEEGVDNCIWIFNPFGTTFPYCNWGDKLCYMPGIEYVQALGLTSYEDGNGTSLKSFESMYQGDYEENKDNFMQYPWIISEFGAGAGGEKQYDYSTGSYTTTSRGRNEYKQAAWVKAMFDEFNDPSKEYCKNIKAAVWFSVNDYVTVDGTDYIRNYFALAAELDRTLLAFKNGFATWK